MKHQSRKKQRKYTLEDKEQVIALYLQGFAINQISKQLIINVKQVWLWVEIYKLHGKKGLRKKQYKQTTSAFKTKVVNQVIENSLPLDRAAIKYRLSVSKVN